MRRSAFVLAALSPLAAAAAPAPQVVVKEIRAPHPPHCLAADQWSDPGVHSPLAAFDGDLSTGWLLCPEAAHEEDYTLDVRLVEPVSIDRVRVSLQGDVTPKGKHSRPRRISLTFYDTSLSELPLYFRDLEIPDDRPTADLGVEGPLAWNPNLIDDMDFGQKRRERKLGDTIPMPLTVDRIGLVFREFHTEKLPVRIAEVQLMLDKKALPIAGTDAARVKHLDFVERGLRYIVDGRTFGSDARTLRFEKDGSVMEILPDHPPRRLGAWRIQGARLEFAAAKKFEPVDYLLDGAPQKVLLRTKPLEGEYRITGAAKVPASAVPVEPPADTPPPLVDMPP